MNRETKYSHQRKEKILVLFSAGDHNLGGKENDEQKTMDMRKATKDQELRKLALLSERELMMELRTSEKGLSNEDAEKD